MDPIIVAIIAVVAATGGAWRGAMFIRRRRRQRALRAAVFDKVDHGGRDLSIFDVFWDLGGNEYALALMDHQGLLAGDPDDFDHAHRRLDELIAIHGTYTDFLEDNLAAIGEFYHEHRRSGHRRKIPTLTLRARKLLPQSGPAGSDGPPPLDSDRRRTDQPAGPGGGGRRRAEGRGATAGGELDGELGLIVRESVQDRLTLREQAAPLMRTTVRPAEQMPAHQVVDIDELVSLEPMAMLKNIFDGRLTDEVQKWWKFRHLRAAKSRLDDLFEAFYGFYVDQANSRADFYDMLYDTAGRWKTEAGRIGDLEVREPWADEPFAECAEMMVAEAGRLARQLSGRAQSNVDATIEGIHQFARDGDQPMAGYLLYLNHHAFFAGRAPGYGEHVQRIERQTYRVREELRKLRGERQL